MYATRIVALCAEHLEFCLAFSKYMSSRFAWLLGASSIIGYVLSPESLFYCIEIFVQLCYFFHLFSCTLHAKTVAFWNLILKCDCQFFVPICIKILEKKKNQQNYSENSMKNSNMMSCISFPLIIMWIIRFFTLATNINNPFHVARDFRFI